MFARTTTDLLAALRNSHKHSDLQISPNELRAVSIILIICIFIARTCKYALGFGTPFASLKSESGLDVPEGGPHNQTFKLPDLTLSMPLRLRAIDCQTYTTAIEPESKSNVDIKQNNALLALFLAALCEPAMLLLLAKQGCPIRPLGAVNVRNRFEIIDLPSCHALISQIAHARRGSVAEPPHPVLQSSVFARFLGSARRVKKGIEVSVEVTIVSADTNKDADPSGIIPIFRQEFTMLQFVKFNDRQTLSSGYKNNSLQKPDNISAYSSKKAILAAKMSTEAPSVWARLCKDYNPIHFSPIMAKVLGQSGQLAHGNHAVAVCVHELSRLSSDTDIADLCIEYAKPQLRRVKELLSHQMDSTEHKRWWMEVRFRRPIVLPANFGPTFFDEADGFDIVDQKSGKISIEVQYGLD